MAVDLDPDAVLDETAALMAYTLRSGGFARGQGGTDTGSFTASTTPTIERAQKVVQRHTRIVVADFPSATDAQADELTTVAALRSAIELENSTPQVDRDRILGWREQLREFVGRFSESGGSGSGGSEPGAELKPAWSFGDGDPCHTPGSELPYPSRYAPDGRMFRW
jgi:hypothetical protein